MRFPFPDQFTIAESDRLIAYVKAFGEDALLKATPQWVAYRGRIPVRRRLHRFLEQNRHAWRITNIVA